MHQWWISGHYSACIVSDQPLFVAVSTARQLKLAVVPKGHFVELLSDKISKNLPDDDDVFFGI
ncbi:hypothetical protein KIN20_010835 [Parelaphostrongylus tenuis]|uniref:Uncharacterized protein n=1 Tax=Parelaphostrongylus tenuis TaxID=148309 RepID=A0AAD5MA73_PARTN|nr:hypothetical protein KIN20_010835 [Parelaphostrongylus tenuis]